MGKDRFGALTWSDPKDPKEAHNGEGMVPPVIKIKLTFEKYASRCKNHVLISLILWRAAVRGNGYET
jgi:hypothetical protein